MATPMRALVAASWRSATRRSGRRRSSEAGSSIANAAGSAGKGATGPSVASSSPGRWPTSTSMRCRALATAASSGGTVDSVVSICASARAVSSAVPRPASRRACTSSSARRWFCGIALRHDQLLLRAAQLEVVARDLGDHRETHVVAGGTAATAARRAPPGCRAARDRRDRAPSWRRNPLRTDRSRARRAHRRACRPDCCDSRWHWPGCGRRHEIPLLLAPHGARLLQPRLGCGEVAVRLQRLRHQIVEQRIAEQLPPLPVAPPRPWFRPAFWPSNAESVGGLGDCSPDPRHSPRAAPATAATEQMTYRQDAQATSTTRSSLRRSTSPRITT